MADTDVRFKDFTKKRPPVFFTIGEQRFDCYQALPVETMQEITKKAEVVNTGNAMTALTEFFELVMQPEAVIRLKAMMSDKVDPLEMDQATDIFMWLLEVYGLRPTTSSSGSSAGLPTDGAGTPSTDGVSLAESTP